MAYLDTLFGSSQYVTREQLYNDLSRKHLPIYYRSNVPGEDKNTPDICIRWNIDKHMLSLELSQMISVAILAAGVLMLIIPFGAIGIYNMKHGINFFMISSELFSRVSALVWGLSGLAGAGLVGLAITTVAKRGYLKTELTRDQVKNFLSHVKTQLQNSNSNLYRQIGVTNLPQV